MSANRNKLSKITFPWKSQGTSPGKLEVPIVGMPSISNSRTPANPNPRVVYCLSCNGPIYPHSDCYGTTYRGQYRYICMPCFVAGGLIW